MHRIAILTIALALPLAAQTAAEQLERARFAQDAAGRLDEAIQIYKSLIDSPKTPRDIVAEAQVRLAQALVQKGNAPPSKALPAIPTLPSTPPAPRTTFLSPSDVYTSVWKAGKDPRNFSGPPVTIQGNVVHESWFSNPLVVIKVLVGNKGYAVVCASPSALSRQGLRLSELKDGLPVTFTIRHANQGPLYVYNLEVVQADALTLSPGRTFKATPNLIASSRAAQ